MLKDSLREMFGFQKPETVVEQPRFYTQYFGVTPEQFKQSNYPDQYISGYAAQFNDRENFFRIDIYKEGGQWGTQILTRSRLWIYLENDNTRLPEDQLCKLTELTAKLCKELRPKGVIEVVNLGSSTLLDAAIEITSPLGLPKAFSTKEEIADFVSDTLPKLGLVPNGWYCAYFAGMTMEEILACNFPRETWPNKLVDQESLKNINLQK